MYTHISKHIYMYIYMQYAHIYMYTWHQYTYENVSFIHPFTHPSIHSVLESVSQPVGQSGTNGTHRCQTFINRCPTEYVARCESNRDVLIQSSFFRSCFPSFVHTHEFSTHMPVYMHISRNTLSRSECSPTPKSGNFPLKLAHYDGPHEVFQMRRFPKVVLPLGWVHLLGSTQVEN